MNNSKFKNQYSKLTVLLYVFFLYPCILFAQRIEVHPFKDLSNHAIANKAWGVGAAIDFDNWVKNTTFRAHFDWSMYRKKDNITNPYYQKLCGGISAFYSIRLSKRILLQCGVDFNYTNLKHTYIFEIDTVNNKPITIQQTGNFIGIGSHIGVCYEFTPRFSVGLNIIPSYLVPVNQKSSIKRKELEYKKGIWMFPIQLSFSFKLFNLEQ
ncbi:MAG: hypothetical protein LBU83_01100 [Bacteroidales bacterium]|jgi:hypothetical protein|nr:hypothetical protein [Bacteroidales bacterium]